jgi:hypothetical protein
MSRLSDGNLRGVPTKPYDMVREGLVVLAGVTLLIVLLAVLWGLPDYPPLTPKEVATKEPIAFLQRTLSYFRAKAAYRLTALLTRMMTRMRSMSASFARPAGSAW